MGMNTRSNGGSNVSVGDTVFELHGRSAFGAGDRVSNRSRVTNAVMMMSDDDGLPPC
jgi:hypothetical protein